MRYPVKTENVKNGNTRKQVTSKPVQSERGVRVKVGVRKKSLRQWKSLGQGQGQCYGQAGGLDRIYGRPWLGFGKEMRLSINFSRICSILTVAILTFPILTRTNL